MYRKVEHSLRMTENEASERYPDSFILIRMDSMETSCQAGTILYIGDNQRELFSLMMNLDDPSYCGVIEGLNHQRSLGGIVVGG